MNFSKVFNLIMKGSKVTRAVWKTRYKEKVYLRYCITREALRIFDGKEEYYYNPVQEDILSKDWEAIDDSIG